MRSFALGLLRLALPFALIASLALPSLALAFNLPPSQTGRSVYDLAGIWAPSTITDAQAIADGIKARTGAEVAVVSIPTGSLTAISTSQAQIDARTIMDTWGVGQAGVNDGLVVLFDMDASLLHGQIYLYTGSGFAKLYLNDGDAQAIANEMIAQAKLGNFDNALITGMSEIDAAAIPGGNPNLGKADAWFLPTLVGSSTLALILLGLFGWAWWRWGRDPRIPLIDDSVLMPAPPPGLTPAMAAALRLDGVDQSVFTTALVDLAHRGLISFREDKTLFGADKLDILSSGQAMTQSDSTEPGGDQSPEAGLAASIASAAALEGGVLTAAVLRQGTGARLFAAFKSQMGQAAQASPWFANDPTGIINSWRAIGGAIITICVLAAFFAHSSEALYVIAPMGVVGLVFALGAGLMVSRTQEGAQVLAMTLAYRNTLRYELAGATDMDGAARAVKAKLPWLTTPDELTVWALALGLSDDVSKVMARSFSTEGSNTGWHPVWYQAASMAGFGVMMGSISTMASSSFSSAGAGGGGGFGGGGGGGGGGAGGGF